MNCGWMLRTEQPTEPADPIAKFKFSILWNTVAGWMWMAYGEIGGTLPEIALLISLLNH